MRRWKFCFAALVAVAATIVGSSASADSGFYKFIGEPVLLASGSSYTVLFNLTPDLPRNSSHRVQGTAFLNGHQTQAVSGGGKHPTCFDVGFGSPVGKPRYGTLYTFVLRDNMGHSLTRRLRLKKATKGFEPTSDPKAAALRCHSPT